MTSVLETRCSNLSGLISALTNQVSDLPWIEIKAMRALSCSASNIPWGNLFKFFVGLLHLKYAVSILEPSL